MCCDSWYSGNHIREECIESINSFTSHTNQYQYILFQVVDWLNAASLTSTSSKVELLSKVQETIINNDINLLDNFLDEMLAFQSDRNADVRKFIVGFIEEAR